MALRHRPLARARCMRKIERTYDAAPELAGWWRICWRRCTNCVPDCGARVLRESAVRHDPMRFADTIRSRKVNMYLVAEIDPLGDGVFELAELHYSTTCRMYGHANTAARSECFKPFRVNLN